MYIRKFKQNATLSSAKTDDFLNVLAKIHKMLHNLVNVLMLQLIQIFFGIIFITFEFFILKLPKTIAVYVKLQIKIFSFLLLSIFRTAVLCYRPSIWPGYKHGHLQSFVRP